MKKVVLFFAVSAFALVSCNETCNKAADAAVAADSVIVEEAVAVVDSAVAVVDSAAAVAVDSAAAVVAAAAETVAEAVK